MTEMTHAGKDHSDTVLVCGSNNLVVANGAAGLNNGPDTIFRGVIYGVAEREEGVGCHDRAGNFQILVSGLNGCNFGTINTAHLARSNANGHAVFGVNNGV